MLHAVVGVRVSLLFMGSKAVTACASHLILRNQGGCGPLCGLGLEEAATDHGPTGLVVVLSAGSISVIESRGWRFLGSPLLQCRRRRAYDGDIALVY